MEPVYPTAPFATQAHEQLNVDAPTAHAGTGENVESPGKAKAVLSKVKHNARKLKNKLKKVTGSNTAVTDDGVKHEHDSESYEDDEEEDDLSKPNNHEFKYEQLRSIGALDKQGDGSEVEVHGGFPVSTLADNHGTYWKRADASAPISAYKSAGPPDALQATPTEYRNYAASNDPLLEGENPMSGIPNGLMKDNISRGMDKENNPLGSPSLREVKPSNLSYHDPAEPHTKLGILDTASAIGAAMPSSEDDALKPDPSFGKSSSPTDDEFAVMNEGASTDRRRVVGPPPGEYGRTCKEDQPDIKTSDHLYYEPAQAHSKQGVSASDTDLPYPENLLKHNPSSGKSSSPVYDEIDEDVSPDSRKLGVGFSSDEHVGSGKGNVLDTSVSELKPEVKTLHLSESQPAEPHSNYGVLETASPSDIDVSYPEDLVKPNPLFGKSSSPTHDKIAVMNEDALLDAKLGVGLSTEEYSGNGKGNLLETSVPEFEELSGNRKGSPSVPLEADELVYRPVSDPEIGSPLTSPEPNAAALSSGTGQCLDDSMRQSQEPSERDLENLPRSEVSKAPLKGEDGISSTGANYCEQKPSFNVASEKPADQEKFGVGLSTEEYSGSGKGNLLETSVPEFEQLSGNREGSPSVPPEADELVYRPVSDPEFGSPLTFLEPNAASGTGQCLEDSMRQSQEPSEKDLENLPRPEVSKAPSKGEDGISSTGANYCEQKPSFNVASEKPADREIGTAGDSVRESWGKWSADKINNAKDVTVSGLIATDHRNESENSANNAVEAAGNTEKVARSQNVDTAKPPAVKDENMHLEEEYYDPNEVKDNQFQEGFTLGNAEEDALSGTLAGSAIEKLQGLKETVQSSLGYSNQDDSAAGGEDRPGLEREALQERVLSPGTYQQQKGGFVQGLKETVASSLGYGKAGTDEAGHNNDVPERGGVSETDVSKQQRPGETYRVLKNAVASKLGYGPAEESPIVTKKTESRESPAELTSHELRDNDDGDHQNATKAGLVSSDTRDNADREDEVSDQPRSGGVLQGVKDRVISKLGYSSQPEETYRDTIPTNSVSAPAADQQASSYTQKLINTTAAARDYLSSRVGYGNSNEDKGEINVDDGEKFTNPSPQV